MARRRRFVVASGGGWTRYSDGAFSYRNVDAETGETVSVYFNTGHGRAFYRFRNCSQSISGLGNNCTSAHNTPIMNLFEVGSVLKSLLKREYISETIEKDTRSARTCRPAKGSTGP
jgi:hypothetical protein